MSWNCCLRGDALVKAYMADEDEGESDVCVRSLWGKKVEYSGMSVDACICICE